MKATELGLLCCLLAPAVHAAEPAREYAERVVEPESTCHVHKEPTVSLNFVHVPLRLAAETVSQMTCKRIVFPADWSEQTIDIAEDHQVSAERVARMFVASVPHLIGVITEKEIKFVPSTFRTR